MRHVFHEACAYWIRSIHKHNWNRVSFLLQRPDRYAADCKDRVGFECNYLGGIAANTVNVPTNLTNFDLEIATKLPSQFLKRLLEDFEPNLRFRIIRAEDVDDTDDAYVPRRLRKCRKWPSDG